ncbi:UDP-2,4-diacetamido-2,4,6-trideoxy-beta-L-altropyranose hydrolase [Portibacter lacus]|uniref:N-acetyltransferase domain-containing protein n=1 Tax=Portibacter lacus TaxID=1099794 RepID=A0AA37SRI6_9BACT|nr:UDP-2,4-diacetamido-2,4,6-trideoxy-beta-L-altropyranose hydrolase [Portibacter lacus]GLR18857.1 hypothetical protein GCM10007940_34730 [Portibacter lacus]
MRKRVLFRADGNNKIGLGHVIRSLALADMLKEDFDCYFIIRSPLQTLKDQILHVCQSIHSLPETNDSNEEAELIAEKFLLPSDIVVLDGYHFGLQYQKAIQSVGCKIAFIDDIQHTEFIADVVINHAPGLNRKDFSTSPHTILLLGSEYALLRPPFLKAATQKRSIEVIDTVFVCFGGADFNNLSLKILRLFSAFKRRKYNIKMVLGGANHFKEQVKAFAKTITEFKVDLYENLSAEKMVEIMQQSDCAIVPASSIMYEVLAVKMPVIGGYFVENQINIYHGLNDTDIIRGIGNFNTYDKYEMILEEFNQEKISAILQLQQELGISQSKTNLLKAFNNLELQSDFENMDSKNLTIRKATKEDLMTYSEWANDINVRTNSINSEKISLNVHRVWFEDRLKSPDSILYIFESEKKPVGQLRFEIDKKKATINFSVDSDSRGKGFGQKILQIAVNTLLIENIELEQIVGLVKNNNISSSKIFDNCGFKRSADQEIGGEKYYSYFLDNFESTKTV